MKYFIANWKANKNTDEAIQWIDVFLNQPPLSDRIKVVICPPFPLLHPLKQRLTGNKGIVLGSQDISSFDSGSYTGEVAAKSLQGLVDYVIIGHSERRKYFGETDEIIQKKIENAKKYNIEPILCVRDEKDVISPEVKFIAYEPTSAIGTGKAEEAAKVVEIKNKLKLNNSNVFLYGGSVNKNEVSSYLATSQIDGFLIGTASLDPIEFFAIVTQIQ